MRCVVIFIAPDDPDDCYVSQVFATVKAAKKALSRVRFMDSHPVREIVKTLGEYVPNITI